jgi:hypothetical protein
MTPFRVGEDPSVDQLYASRRCGFNCSGLITEMTLDEIALGPTVLVLVKFPEVTAVAVDLYTIYTFPT